jgi:hypothetical protein
MVNSLKKNGGYEVGQRIPYFSATCMLKTMHTKYCHWALSSAEEELFFHITSFYIVLSYSFLILFSHPLLGLHSCVPYYEFPIKILYSCLWIEGTFNEVKRPPTHRHNLRFVDCVHRLMFLTHAVSEAGSESLETPCFKNDYHVIESHTVVSAL